ncbi:RDD family protein [Acinetobacter stercoris]|uniref:RDD family protein n=1 Tax=Acinetobacter stercoris TaxID=2126983 RepID=A0A2U3N4I9_9GAMM|nr:RDD family protein [Acinetobacter stercoris]SPL72610.1 RDD family protein [Acinetobacter stercoris]
MDYKYEYAGFWIRLLATIIDTIILLAILIPLSIILDATGSGVEEIQPQISISELAWQLLCAVVYIIFWVKCSGTPGKLLLRLKVLDEATGNKISITQGIIRYLGYIVSAIVFCIGYFWIAFDSKKQGWHDKMAKTVVVREL